MVTKFCRWDGGVCRFVSCDIILASGLIVVCERHRNPLGRSLRRKVSVRRLFGKNG